MSILIKGMEMPQGNSNINVLIYSDGRVFTGHKNDDKYSAVEVPTPHGQLIDADDVKSRMIPLDFSVQKWISEVEVSNCKSIIEAEE